MKALGLLLLAVIMSFGGCHSRPDNKIRIALEHFPPTLDPRYATDTLSFRICGIVFSGLIKIGDKLEPVPDLAKEWDASNPHALRFTLRDGLRFQDGTPLTADDVIETYRYIQKSPMAWASKDLNRIDRIEKRSDREIVLHFAKPFSAILPKLTMGILPRRIASKETIAPGDLVGAGPYRIESVLRDRSISLLPNKYYFGSTVKNKGIRFVVIPDASVRALELEKQSVDLVQTALYHESLKSLSQKTYLKQVMAEGVSLTYMGFNLTDPVLRNVNVRQAIAHLIDRRLLINAKFAGLAKPATGLLPSMIWAYEPDVSQYDYNVRLANELLDRAGFRRNPKTGIRFQLIYKTSTDQQRIEIAQIIARQLAEGGIDVKIRPNEFGTFFNDIREGRFQIYTLKVTDVADPDLFYWAFYSKNLPPNGGNRNRYNNKNVDRLIDSARETFERKKAKALYAELQRITARELPYVFLWFENQVAVVNRRVDGYSLTPLGDFSQFPNAVIREAY